jgi:pimeloyl-ACP methyl ester carboxylesterase
MRYVRSLERDFRVVTPDLLGHGRSDRPADPSFYGTPELALDMVDLLNQEEIESADAPDSFATGERE